MYRRSRSVVRPLRLTFVDALSHTRLENCDLEGLDIHLASRKCLIVGALASLVRNTCFKYANVVAVLLKHQMTLRGWLDFLANYSEKNTDQTLRVASAA